MKANIETNRIYECDAVELLERLPAESVDLVYIDPPWPTLAMDDIQGDYNFYISKVIQQAYRILRNTGTIFFYSYPSLSLNIKSCLSAVFGETNFRGDFSILKRKRNKTRVQLPVNDYELVIFFSKSDEYHYRKPVRSLSQREIEQKYPLEDSTGRFFPSPLTDLGTRGFEYEWRGCVLPPNQKWIFSTKELDQLYEEGRILYSDDLSRPYFKRYYKGYEPFTFGSTWTDLPPQQIVRSIPNNDPRYSQPVELIDRIIQTVTQKNDIVLDPFCGFGPTLLAAEKSERRWIGIDYDPEACTTSQYRLQEISQGDSPIIDASTMLMTPVYWNKYLPIGTREISEENKILLAIRRGESKEVEFKVATLWNSLIGAKDKKMIEPIVKSIVGMMNSKEGGDILMGVDDAGSIIGLQKDFEHANPQKRDIDGFLLWLNEKVRHKLGGAGSSFMKAEVFEIERKSICRMHVSPASKPMFLDKKFYVRQTNQTIPLDSENTFEYITTRWPQYSPDNGSESSIE